MDESLRLARLQSVRSEQAGPGQGEDRRCETVGGWEDGVADDSGDSAGDAIWAADRCGCCGREAGADEGRGLDLQGARRLSLSLQSLGAELGVASIVATAASGPFSPVLGGEG